MKNVLLILLALMMTPAWAADAPPATATDLSATTILAQADSVAASTDTVTAACPVQCKQMNCPPPGGSYKLCCPIAPYNQTCP